MELREYISINGINSDFFIADMAHTAKSNVSDKRERD